MFDISSHRPVAPAAVAITAVEFFRIELSPMVDGGIRVSLTATTLDDEEQELLDQDVASHHVASLDDVLALIRTYVRVPPASTSAPIVFK